MLDTRQRLLDVIAEVKHLPGKHDQKTHGHSLLDNNSKLFGRVVDIARTLRNQPTEKGILISSSGKVIFSRSGEKYGIEFPDNGRSSDVFIHNHPGRESTFSFGDIANFLGSKLGTVVVVSKKYTYVLAKPPKFSNTKLVRDELLSIGSDNLTYDMLKKLSDKSGLIYFRIDNDTKAVIKSIGIDDSMALTVGEKDPEKRLKEYLEHLREVLGFDENDEPMVFEKHLPGRHNQQDHAGNRAISSALKLFKRLNQHFPKNCNSWRGTCGYNSEISDELRKQGIKAKFINAVNGSNIKDTLGYGSGPHAYVKLPGGYFVDGTAYQFGIKNGVVFGRIPKDPSNIELVDRGTYTELRQKSTQQKKSGTSEGARKAWISRRRSLEDKLRMALQSRDGFAIAKLRQQIQSGDRVYREVQEIKHLAGLHNQLDHGRKRISDKPLNDKSRGKWLANKMQQAAKQNPKVKDLTTKLLSVGGQYVVVDPDDPDIERIIDRGRVISGGKAKMRCIEVNQCHRNSAKLWASDKKNYKINTGYYLDGSVWLQHSWITNKSGDIIETTGNKTAAYFGVELTAKEAREFADAEGITKHLPGEHNQLSHGHPGTNDDKYSGAKLSRADTEEDWGKLHLKRPTDEQLLEAYHLKDIPISIQVFSGSHGITILGHDKNSSSGIPDKSLIFTRQIELSSDGPTAHHSSFELPLEMRWHGIGSDVTQRSEEFYKDIGVKSITLTANSQVGTYAWARMGLDFGSERARTSIVNGFYSYLHSQSIPESNWPRSVSHSWEIAAYQSSTGKASGKDYLLNNVGEYSASKSLSDDSIGYQVGQAYYASKK